MTDDVGVNNDDQQRQEMVLNYAVLPRILPQEKPKELHRTELQMIAQMIGKVVDLSGILPSKTIESFKRLGRVHDLNVPNVEEVTEQINSLRSGDTFAMFVRRQNCTFTIYVPPYESIGDGIPENMIVATFPGNLHPNEVYKYESDIEVNILIPKF